jgi:NAD(P)-dependent dehydrogenase (short-subunit alcohol dehydrogenase family)
MLRAATLYPTITMARVFVTGSSDGLGRMAGELLISQGGHKVVLHARNQQRADDTRNAVPRAEAVVVGDLASIAQTRAVADQVNALGAFDAIIHNAGVGYREASRRETEDRLEHVFQINVLAPYLLTALAHRPARLIYLSSGLHRQGDPDLTDLQWAQRRWDGYQAYSDSKLFDAVLAVAVARRWPDVISTSVEPGWVRTKMGGPGAPGEIGPGAETQVWLATSTDPLALQSGGHFYHRALRETHPAVADPSVQDGLLAACLELTGEAITEG